MGGGQIYAAYLTDYLRAAGHTVTVFTHTFALNPDAGAEENGIIRLAWPGTLAGKWRLFRKLLRLAAKNDLLYGHYSYRLTALAALTAVIKRKPLYIFAHGLGTIIDLAHPHRHRFYRWLSLKLASGIFAASEEIEEICRRFNRRILLLPTPVDLARINRELDPAEIRKIKTRYPHKKIILTVRRLAPKNGIQYLIESLPYLKKLVPEIVYLVIGDGRLQEKLAARVRELGLDKTVIWLGAQPNEAVYDYIAAADAVVFPSSAEAMSIACLEAMYLGAPIVASRVGGLVDLLGADNQRGRLYDLLGNRTSIYGAPPVETVPPEKHAGFAAAIAEVLKHRPDTSAGKLFVEERHDWVKIIRQILEFSQANGIKDFYCTYDDDIIGKRYQSDYPLRRWVHRSRTDCLLSHLRPGEKILEVGCGDGWFAIAAAKQDRRLVATDLSGPNLKRARQAASAAGVAERIEFIQADAEDLPFAEGQFDLVIASHILEHLPDFHKGLAEIRRVTKRRVLIALPTILNPCSLVIVGGGQWWYLSKKGIGSLLVGIWKTLSAGWRGANGVEQGFYGREAMPHLWRFPQAMRRQLRAAGFAITSFEADSLPLPFFNWLLPLIKFLDRRRGHWLLRHFGYGSHAVLEKADQLR